MSDFKTSSLYIMQYPGSKTRIADRIVSLFPPHTCYVEVFGGTAAVLMAKPPSATEVYNDINSDLVTLFRVVRDTTTRAALQRVLDWTPFARDEFADIVKRWRRKKYTDDVEHARVVFSLYNQTIQGLATRAYWRNSALKSPADVFRKKIEALDAIGGRFANVQIENKHFAEVLNIYDRPDTLFYLDPPYVGETRAADIYEHEMYIHEHKQMIDWLLGSMKGSAILSGYDHPLYSPLVDKGGWIRHEIQTTMTMANQGASGGYESPKDNERTEVLWVSPSSGPPRRLAQKISLGGSVTHADGTDMEAREGLEQEEKSDAA